VETGGTHHTRQLLEYFIPEDAFFFSRCAPLQEKVFLFFEECLPSRTGFAKYRRSNIGWTISPVHQTPGRRVDLDAGVV
jgi:hypothetical protein